MPSLLKDLITIPEHVSKGDFVLKLTDGTAAEHAKATLANYVVTPQLAACFDQALKIVQGALKGNSSKAAYLHGSFGAGKSHFMAVLHFLLQGNVEARSIPALGDVVTRHNDWLPGKKFLMVPFHLMAAKDLESALFKGYTDYVLANFPQAPYPPLFTSDGLLSNAATLRANLGDEKFFSTLNQAKTTGGAGGGWGSLNKWTSASFDQATKAPPTEDSRRRLVSALVETHFPAMRSTNEFVSIDDGLAIMSAHAKALGFDALILFLDELILWLASHAADVTFVSREAQKIPKIVESQNANRPIPIISFVARQRDLRELVGQHIAGAEKLGFIDVLSYQEGRFDTIPLANSNLPAIAKERILRPRDENARRLIDEAFAQTAKFREEVMSVLLTRTSKREEFRDLYPFSPALVETLVAVSSLLQRERTAIKVMVQLLSKQRHTLALGEIIPLGDLYDEIAEGDDAFSADMKVYFDKANNLYQQTLRPMLEAQHSLTFADAQALPASDAKRTALRADDRLIKTLLLAALAPAVESLKNMTPQRLAALNHGTIRTFVPGQEAQLVLQRCKDWAARVGQLSVQEGAGGIYTISLQVTDLDMRPILDRAESVDNHGNRVARMKGLIFEALGMSDHQELFFRYPFRWRGTDREAEVSFGNVREISDEQLETRGASWKIVIDYPFDRAGHNLNEDLERLSQFRSLAVVAENRTICWLPGFLNHEAQKAIGTLVRLEHILEENRFRTFVAHLSEQNQAAARPLLESQRDMLKGQLRLQIEALYGLREPQPQYADPANQLSGADHLQSMCQLSLRPPVAATLRDALNGILAQAMEHQFPAAPVFEEEARFTKTNVSKVLEVIEQALASTEPSVVVADPAVRKIARQIANPLKLGEMHETRFQLGHHWRNHFAQRQARDAGQPVTVLLVRKWLDEPQAMGLPKLASDLVIRVWAEQTNRGFFARTGASVSAITAPALGELQDEMEVREVSLPAQSEWNTVVERAKAIFGVDATSPLLNANNVSILCAKVRAKVEEWMQPAILLEDQLDKAAAQFGAKARQFPRSKTASEGVELLRLLKATGGELAFTKALANQALNAQPLVLSHSFKTAAAVTATVANFQGNLFKALQNLSDERAKEASAILAALHDSFARDEYAVCFASKVTELANQAITLLAATPPPPAAPPPPLPPPDPTSVPPGTVAPPPVAPPPQAPPVAKRVRTSQIKADPIPEW
ncbi:MAG: hypothetical protein RL376_520, partial [Verrucomicrobiota bacterium]